MVQNTLHNNQIKQHNNELCFVSDAGTQTEFLEVEKRNSQPSDFSGDRLSYVVSK